MEWYSDPNKTTKVSQIQKKKTKIKLLLSIYNLNFFLSARFWREGNDQMSHASDFMAQARDLVTKWHVPVI